jgi:hypothetical protein
MFILNRDNKPVQTYLRRFHRDQEDRRDWIVEKRMISLMISRMISRMIKI